MSSLGAVTIFVVVFVTNKLAILNMQKSYCNGLIKCKKCNGFMTNSKVSGLAKPTVLPAKSDSEVMFCLLSYL